ncbi:MAG: hypothetical protein ACOX3R_02845 [Desulfitobacteriia bacterium]
MQVSDQYLGSLTLLGTKKTVFALRSENGFPLCTPSMGVIYTVKVRNGGWRAPTVAENKGVRREAESEGSLRQMHGLRYTNPI